MHIGICTGRAIVGSKSCCARRPASPAQVTVSEVGQFLPGLRQASGRAPEEQRAKFESQRSLRHSQCQIGDVPVVHRPERGRLAVTLHCAEAAERVAQV